MTLSLSLSLSAYEIIFVHKAFLYIFKNNEDIQDEEVIYMVYVLIKIKFSIQKIPICTYMDLLRWQLVRGP